MSKCTEAYDGRHRIKSFGGQGLCDLCGQGFGRTWDDKKKCRVWVERTPSVPATDEQKGTQ